ncbi:MAG: 50S ribosomal protein L24 [Microgenomates group bacterium GW2011_GWF2_45_18]|nr:MAG: 50S ribosomal protein L24 [Microgenomates group bacterium GW2011_GWF1_44_10]KKU01978.1 MAG: 50S ribosomal protein L24 [Microgenomates group bacterium GW2011_GWF2_45_18]OGJ41008.1 MAG: 50S ribosomal protein L24 [Candidatus Pacebacteria bacterium RIFOXYB1_FULL_44_10]HAU99037.1 50S ribosomal protein L24 [Candidatus Paceibacterota bacterium]HAX01248.1 50S ribosomal protein L24 [Candidatus Paceibacterota bacterium]
MKLQKNDMVKVTAGKDKGKSGKILRVYPKENKVIVEGVNMYVKHIKKQGQKSGERVIKERSLPSSNVAILNPDTNKIDRVGYMVDDTGNKVRIYKKTKKVVMV